MRQQNVKFYKNTTINNLLKSITKGTSLFKVIIPNSKKTWLFENFEDLLARGKKYLKLLVKKMGKISPIGLKIFYQLNFEGFKRKTLSNMFKSGTEVEMKGIASFCDIFSGKGSSLSLLSIKNLIMHTFLIKYL